MQRQTQGAWGWPGTDYLCNKPMKTYTLLLSLTAVLALSNGCSKQESTPPPVSEAPKAADTAASEAKKAVDAAQSQVPAVQQATDKAAADVQAQAVNAQKEGEKAAADAQAQTASISSKAQSLIDAAKKFIADKNWADASKTLAEVSNLKLTPDQQSMVDSLKEQVTKMAQDAAAAKATDQAGKALGGLLNKK